MYKRRFGNQESGGFAPVNVGDELDLTIEAVGEKGDGIAKVKGFVIFVPGTKQGEIVKVKINKVLRKVGFGEVVGKGNKDEPKEGTEESSENKEESKENTEESNEDYSTQDSTENSETEDSENFG